MVSGMRDGCVGPRTLAVLEQKRSGGEVTDVRQMLIRF